MMYCKVKNRNIQLIERYIKLGNEVKKFKECTANYIKLYGENIYRPCDGCLEEGCFQTEQNKF